MRGFKNIMYDKNLKRRENPSSLLKSQNALRNIRVPGYAIQEELDSLTLYKDDTLIAQENIDAHYPLFWLNKIDIKADVFNVDEVILKESNQHPFFAPRLADNIFTTVLGGEFAKHCKSRYALCQAGNRSALYVDQHHVGECAYMGPRAIFEFLNIPFTEL